MPTFDYRCTQCGHVIEDQYFPIREPQSSIPCPLCHARAKKILQFPAIKRTMSDHFNATLGRPVSSERDFRNGLSEASDKASIRAQREVSYSPVDLRDKAAVGVNDEGLDQTRRRERAEGKSEAKKYL